MITVGIDVSTCTGIARVGDNEDRGQIIQLPKQREFLRLQLIAQNVERILSNWQPDLVVIEDYSHCMNVKTFIIQVECGTVIREVLYRLQCQWIEVPPSTLKKWTTGKGNAKKDQMAEAVKNRWGYISPSDDINDAYALAQMGQLGVEEILKLKGCYLGYTKN
jgi:crossover junction endodeoxyribonuclease RuvC